MAGESVPEAVPSTGTRTGVQLDEQTELDPRTGEPQQAHIVKTEPGESAAAKILEARIYGTPVEALCGWRWIPSRDPRKYPLCQTCREIYELYRAMNDGLGETPPS